MEMLQTNDTLYDITAIDHMSYKKKMHQTLLSESEALTIATDWVSIGQMADAIMDGLEEYASLATDWIMSMIQKIDGKQVPFKTSATIPRIYRIKFHRDIYKNLDVLGKAVGNGDEGSSHLDMFSLEMFENIAYIMAKHADPTIPDSPEEWLDEFSTFSIYQVLPKIIQLWGLNVQTDVESKKTSCN